MPPAVRRSRPAGRSTSVVNEYAGSVRLVAEPDWLVAMPVAPLVRVDTVGATVDGVNPA